PLATAPPGRAALGRAALRTAALGRRRTLAGALLRCAASSRPRAIRTGPLGALTLVARRRRVAAATLALLLALLAAVLAALGTFLPTIIGLVLVARRTAPVGIRTGALALVVPRIVAGVVPIASIRALAGIVAVPRTGALASVVAITRTGAFALRRGAVAPLARGRAALAVAGPG
ncbi:hypothetical protein CH341_31590, partial [Rhodoplanes roseus]